MFGRDFLAFFVGSGEQCGGVLDEEIPFMRHAIWAEGIDPALAKIVKARYYGEITYLDHCLGRIVDAVEARPNSENILICFFSDHGDLLGDHHGWQTESYFEAACNVPFLVSWPAKLPAGSTRDDLVCHADVFGIATGAAGHQGQQENSDEEKAFARHLDLLFHIVFEG